MIRGKRGGGGQLVVAVMFEALTKFGRIDAHNRDQVARWVKRRVDELRDGPEPRDGRMAAAGGDRE